MFSIRNTTIRAAAISIFALSLLAGCQVTKPIPPVTELNRTPVETDDAMAARQWTETDAKYQNDQVTCGSTLMYFGIKAADPEINNAGSDIGIFLLDMVMMPYTVCENPAWKRIAYKSMVMPPTYSGNPPLPKEPVAGLK